MYINKRITQQKLIIDFRCIRDITHFNPIHDEFKAIGTIIFKDYKGIITKASKRLHVIKVLKRAGVLPAYDLIHICFALIWSVLEYCCVDGLTISRIIFAGYNKTEMVQKCLKRIVFPDFHYNDALTVTKCIVLIKGH